MVRWDCAGGRVINHLWVTSRTVTRRESDRTLPGEIYQKAVEIARCATSLLLPGLPLNVDGTTVTTESITLITEARFEERVEA